MTASKSRPVLVLASLGVSFGFACWLAAPFGFPFELARHFTPHICLAALLIAGIWAWARAHIPSFVAGVVTLMLGLAWLWVPFKSASPETGPDRITVAVFNAGYTPEAIARAADWAEAQNVDVIMLAEAHGIELETLRTQFEHWPYAQIAGPRGRPPGADWQIRSALFSRWPMQTTLLHERLVDQYSRAVIQMEVAHPSGSLQVTGLHPLIPLLPQGLVEQGRMFQSVSDHVPSDGRFIVMGDMNTTVWSPNFKKLPGLRAGDPRFTTTFPAPVWIGGMAIDHIMVGEGFDVVRTQRGPHLGSDHFPILVELALREG